MKLFCKDRKAFLSFGAVFALCCSGLVQNSWAQATITTITPLYFGEIVILDYSAVGRVTISPSGLYSYNSNVLLHTPPQRGEYQLSGGPPSTFYTIDINPTTASLTGPGGPFTLDTLAITPAILVTDAAGEDTFYLSGRLQTLGGGTPYGDGSYSTNILLTMNF
jgi:hypothetical protein